MRKQRIVLKQISDFSLLRRKIDAAFAVEQHGSVQRNIPTVRLFNTGYAFECHAFAAAGCTEQAEHAALCLQ